MALKLKLLPRYIVTFGLLHGVVLFIKVEIIGAVQISLKGVTHPFELRANTSDALVFREVFLFKSYDRAWREPNVVVDGGGNIGLVSIFFASCFPNARILKVEPSNSYFETLQKNTKSYSWIEIIHFALWSKDENLIISNKAIVIGLLQQRSLFPVIHFKP